VYIPFARKQTGITQIQKLLSLSFSFDINPSLHIM
jgi:hypothetical protein